MKATTILAAVGALLTTRMTLPAQSPTPEKTKAELIRDIQSPVFDEAGPKAVEVATQKHDLEILTAGLVSPRGDVRRLCLDSLDSFTEDQRKAAIRTSLLTEAAWYVQPGSAAGTSDFMVQLLFAEKLKQFGIVIEPNDLYSTEKREAIVKRLLPAPVH